MSNMDLIEEFTSDFIEDEDWHKNNKIILEKLNKVLSRLQSEDIATAGWTLCELYYYLKGDDTFCYRRNDLVEFCRKL